MRWIPLNLPKQSGSASEPRWADAMAKTPWQLQPLLVSPMHFSPLQENCLTSVCLLSGIHITSVLRDHILDSPFHRCEHWPSLSLSVCFLSPRALQCLHTLGGFVDPSYCSHFYRSRKVPWRLLPSDQFFGGNFQKAESRRKVSQVHTLSLEFDFGAERPGIHEVV